MEKISFPFMSWRDELSAAEVASIDNDFILLDRPVVSHVIHYPFKVDVTTAIICLKGRMKGAINMQPYDAQGPCLFVILSGQIMQYESFSDDFSGLFIIMSSRFLNELMMSAQERLPLNLSIQDTPCVSLTEREIGAMVSYFNMLKEALVVKENPYRMEIAKHLTKAFFYGAGYHIHRLAENKEDQSKQEVLVEKFLSLVQTHYKEQRGLEFYADKLCLTPKHVSKVIKETSGTSANDWIDSHVILEAKALLKSTNMTVQQISDELNFPSQSFFGKYFKRHTGLAPKDYRKG